MMASFTFDIPETRVTERVHVLLWARSWRDFGYGIAIGRVVGRHIGREIAREAYLFSSVPSHGSRFYHVEMDASGRNQPA